jgi:hypothetical protein
LPVWLVAPSRWGVDVGAIGVITLVLLTRDPPQWLAFNEETSEWPWARRYFWMLYSPSLIAAWVGCAVVVGCSAITRDRRLPWLQAIVVGLVAMSAWRAADTHGVC